MQNSLTDIINQTKSTLKSLTNVDVITMLTGIDNEEALFMGKEYSAISFNFGPNCENYYIIDESLFKQLKEFLNS